MRKRDILKISKHTGQSKQNIEINSKERTYLINTVR